MYRHLLCLAFLGTAVFLGGCQSGQLPTEPEAQATTEVQLDPEQQVLLEKILKSQTSAGSVIKSLSKDISRKEALKAQAAGPSLLQRDFGVARGLLVSVRKAVHREDWDTAASDLDRLEATIGLMLSETPASQVLANLERACFALQGSAAGIEADYASVCVLAALDVALDNADAPLVPEIAGDLEKTKKSIDRGEYKDAQGALTRYVGTVSAHRSLTNLKRAAEGVRGAREAMLRKAGYVVVAELDQLSDLLNSFGTMLKAAPEFVEEETQEAEPEETPAADEETGQNADAAAKAPSPETRSSGTPAEKEPQAGPEASPEASPARR